MKKTFLFLITLFLSILTLTSCNSYSSGTSSYKPFEEKLKLTDSIKCKDCSIKFMSDNFSSELSYYVTPNGFEMNKLSEKGYYMTITVSFDVYYEKSYNVLWDVGYMGSPKYEVSIVNSDNLGKMDSNQLTYQNKVSRSIAITSSVSDMIGQRFILKFSTDNVQNIIHFEDINVKYNCLK